MDVVTWSGVENVEKWLSRQHMKVWKDEFEKNGCLVVTDVVDEDSLSVYRKIYDRMLKGEINTKNHRHDLGGFAAQTREGKENICQIMWPSVYIKNLDQGPIHQRTECIAKAILGEDMEFDFDMLIAKAPHTNTATEWHQDESYWPDMPDKRAVSFWCAIDDATVDNGCMWFVPGSHNEGAIRKHRHPVPGSHLQMTDDCSESEGTPYPLRAGSCTGHHGRTLHYTRGNITDKPRRAFIVNYRPKAMVEWERNHGFDHGKKGLDGCVENPVQNV